MHVGVIITDRYLQSHRLCYALDDRGKIFLVKPRSILFVLPDFVPLERVFRLDEILGTAKEDPKRFGQIPLTPEDNVQEYNEILNEVALRLNHFKLQTMKAISSIRKNVKSVYELLKNKDSARTTSVITPDVAKKLFSTEKPTFIQLYATHKLLADDLVHFVPDPARHLETAAFLVRANRDILLVSRISNWIRESSLEFEAFLDKSRKIIAISRSLPRVNAGPTKLDVELPTELCFNGNDRLIIEFISAYVTGRKGFIPNNLLALAPLLIKRTGMYPAEIIANPDRDAAKLFLTEIGIWQSSENIISQTDAGSAMRSIYRDQLACETFGDENRSIRHDFGDMPVYTIDDASAHELDDGISIEESDQETWLHIHIANPSAFVPPQSRIAMLARLRQTTLYLPDKMYSMLPIGDPNFSARGFSKDTGAMPTMTFSARLGSDGNIVEYNVRPGLVRNVRVLTYNDVNKAIAPGSDVNPESWWTQSYSEPNYEHKKFDTISAETKAQLLAIEKMVQSHRSWRTRQGALRLTFHGSLISVTPPPLELKPMTLKPATPTDHAARRKTVPSFVRGNAGIKITLDSSQRYTFARLVVEEMMIIANRVAGLFARDNNIPVAYRRFTTTIPQSLLDRVRTYGSDIIPSSLSQEIIATSGGWALQLSTSPENHDFLGISAENGGYVQVTSPMRRYVDMLAHWQFGAFFRGEEMPFTSAQLSGTGEYSLMQVSRRTFRRIAFTRDCNQFYTAQAVSRLLADPDSIKSTHLEFICGKPRLTGILVDKGIQGDSYRTPRSIWVKELGVLGRLALLPDERIPNFGTEFPVEIDLVGHVDGHIGFRCAKSS